MKKTTSKLFKEGIRYSILRPKNRKYRKDYRYYRTLSFIHKKIISLLSILLVLTLLFHYPIFDVRQKEQVDMGNVVKAEKLKSDITFQNDLYRKDNINFNNKDIVCLDKNPIKKDKELKKKKPKIHAKDYDISFVSSTGFKCYMPYTAITDRTSNQYKLQKEFAYTGDYGIRMVYDRYCIAIGTYFDAPVGTPIDLKLENDKTIKCIVADIKADRDTDQNCIMTRANRCVSEFVIDNQSLHSMAKKMGDMSYCSKDWKPRVISIKVYDQNIFDGGDISG